MVKTDTQPASAGRIYEFSINKVFKIKEDSRTRTYQYTIETVNGKQQLNIGDENGAIVQIFDITISNDNMVWTLEQVINNNPDYSKGTTTANFKRQI